MEDVKEPEALEATAAAAAPDEMEAPPEEQPQGGEAPLAEDGVMTFIITFKPSTRRVDVSGPINDKILVYGVMECAKDAIRDHHAMIEMRAQMEAAAAAEMRAKLGEPMSPAVFGGRLSRQGRRH